MSSGLAIARLLRWIYQSKAPPIILHRGQVESWVKQSYNLPSRKFQLNPNPRLEFGLNLQPKVRVGLTPTFELLFEDEVQLQFQPQVEVKVNSNSNLRPRVGVEFNPTLTSGWGWVEPEPLNVRFRLLPPPVQPRVRKFRLT